MSQGPMSKATIKRNSDTWDSNQFNVARERKQTQDSWARLVSLNPQYPNVHVTKNQIVFGRGDSSDVRLHDGAVSNTHCKLYREVSENDDEDETVWLQDLSTNGTFVRDRKIGKGNKVQISSGTEIVLIPRGENRVKVSFVLYLPRHEESPVEAPQGDVTFVFTDIQNSTTLWESSPDSMNIALKMHDKTLRRLLVLYRGYEVKTEGDAFMVAFASVLDAILWCLAVQYELLKAKWPETLLQQPAACVSYNSNSTKIFAGIRVRMGIHVGAPNCRKNPVTNRMDYYGPVVNRCARLSDSAHGGQIVATEEARDAYIRTKDELGDKETYPDIDPLLPIDVKHIGAHSYKGISEAIDVYQFSSQMLSERNFPPLRSEETLRKSRKHGSSRFIEDEKQSNEVGDEVHICGRPGCGKVESMNEPFGACGRCKSVKYCGPDCQKQHWKTHKKVCKEIASALQS